MGQRVIWSCMSKDVTQWVKDCQTCSRAKVTRQPAAALQPIPVPRQWFSHIHMDIVVSREGFHYLFTIINRSPGQHRDGDLQRRPHRPVGGLLRRPGLPHVRPRRAVHLHAVGMPLQRHHNTTTAYHPQSNGMVETHRWLKDALKVRMAAAN